MCIVYRSMSAPLAQLVRALVLWAKGPRFEPVMEQHKFSYSNKNKLTVLKPINLYKKTAKYTAFLPERSKGVDLRSTIR